MYFHNNRYAETYGVRYSAKMKLAHFLFAKKAIKLTTSRIAKAPLLCKLMILHFMCVFSSDFS